MAHEKDKVEAQVSKKSPSKKKNPKSLKPKPKIAKKPDQSTSNPEKAKNVDRNQEKSTSSKKERDKDQSIGSKRERIDGMIFMCNSKTKSDCFKYMVMGLPQGKKDIVATIKPGLKLFLYDFKARLLHGIYKATSAGGMKLEPAAFDGAYPAQVRFKVHMECFPLSEGTFRKIIMGGNMDGKLNFDTELTTQQVKKLTSLFQPKVKPNTDLSVQSPQLVQIPAYQLMRPIIPPMGEFFAHGSYALNGRPSSLYTFNESRSQKGPAPLPRETAPRDPLSFGEKEYRMFGLKGQPLAPACVPSSVVPESTRGNRETYIPYQSETDYETVRRIGEREFKTHATESSSYQHDPYAESSRLHSTHAASALSDYNRSHQEPSSRISEDYASLPVSSRYSFAGPSLSY